MLMAARFSWRLAHLGLGCWQRLALTLEKVPDLLLGPVDGSLGCLDRVQCIFFLQFIDQFAAILGSRHSRVNSVQFAQRSPNSILCVFFVLWAYIQEIQGELEGSKFDITGRALSGLLRWIGTIERSSSSLRTPSGHFRMCSNKNNYFK